MIKYITKDKQKQFSGYLDQYFRLRKQIFCDFYQWVEPNPDGTETDYLDEIDNLYILYIDPKTDNVLGGARMVPTTGETLMHTVWVDMLPEPDDFRSPNLWGVTRLCVDMSSNAGRTKDLVNGVVMALMLAIVEFSSVNGITALMAVCESRVVRMCDAFGCTPNTISSKVDQNGCDISFVVWPTDDGVLLQNLEWAREHLGGATPVRFKAA